MTPTTPTRPPHSLPRLTRLLAGGDTWTFRLTDLEFNLEFIRRHRPLPDGCSCCDHFKADIRAALAGRHGHKETAS